MDSDSLSHSLAITNYEKDLGVWITLSLCPSIQYQKSYAKAMQSHATIKWSIKYITKKSFNILYNNMYLVTC